MTGNELFSALDDPFVPDDPFVLDDPFSNTAWPITLVVLILGTLKKEKLICTEKVENLFAPQIYNP